MGASTNSPSRATRPSPTATTSCPRGWGLTTSINFQPVGAGKAAINGDFALTGGEINNVIAALRKGGITIVEVHNHSLDEQPRLFYLHFWAVDDAVTLAKAVRPALDATNVLISVRTTSCTLPGTRNSRG